ncbi:MAG TPA: polysaccharide deacetylase family protein [Mesorhizobium sp.]
MCLAPIPILTYHQIAIPAKRGSPFRSLTVHPGRFRRHMRWLARLGYRGLSMRDLMPYLLGQQRGKVFGLTFDDGFQNVSENVLPVLAETGYTATNYFVAGHPGGSNFWDRDKGVPEAPLMSARQISEWAGAGHEVGAHTVDHVDLPQLEESDAAAQIRMSRVLLEELVGVPVSSFCYPYGKYGPEHVRIARMAGFSTATTTVRGHVRHGADMWQLPRVPVVRSTSFLRLAQKLFTSYEDRRGRGA